MNYQFSGIVPIRDAQGNVTGFTVSFNGRNNTTGDYINGSIHITVEQFTATAGNVDQINALIAPAISALNTPPAG
ncbi:hypothetical protein E4665_17810 [Sporolactobacillus shoreae]|uniref:Uncharacterized protein n=1 Tax=Sporolactobacillus shoreae TaxID=1465501 RepID=A0A4Z0GHV0_9BACL|nr:hypothetical protein [Sporolactobacillus shoreae]TGA95604.1 hypothetical protein E4665_17810 [Sporolactobacillus shoreae]